MSDASNAPQTPLQQTVLHAEHKALGGRLVPFAGYEMPVQYAGVVKEHQAVRTAAGLFDVCHMGELVLSGEYAGHVVDYLVTNDCSRLQDGQALYTCCCNEDGKVLDDLIVYKAARDRFLIVCNASNREKIVGVFKKAAENHCDFEDVSDKTALLALQGPKAFEILARCGGDGPNFSHLRPFSFTDGVLCNVRATVARTGYTGEDGVEIFCDVADAPSLWRQLLEIGREFGIEPCGLACRDTLRLEARLSLYGNEIDETTNPLEAGLGWVVKFEKEMFVGKEALKAVKEAGLTRKLVGFEVTGKGIARHGYPLQDKDGNVVGICTSGSPAPTLNKNIGLGYLPAALAEVGTEFFVDCRGKAIAATVVKTPFYKRAKGN